jgi:hypothetical protein
MMIVTLNAGALIYAIGGGRTEINLRRKVDDHFSTWNPNTRLMNLVHCTRMGAMLVGRPPLLADCRPCPQTLSQITDAQLGL